MSLYYDYFGRLLVTNFVNLRISGLHVLSFDLHFLRSTSSTRVNVVSGTSLITCFRLVKLGLGKLVEVLLGLEYLALLLGSLAALVTKAYARVVW